VFEEDLGRWAAPCRAQDISLQVAVTFSSSVFLFQTRSSQGADAVLAVLQAWQTWASVVGLSVTGVLPKAGPGRALSFALRSRLFFKPETMSVRDEDAAKLRQLLIEVDKENQAYIEVVGPKGIGKSVLIDTVLAHKAGLVEVEVHPGMIADTLIDKVHRAVGGFRVFGSSDGDAKRVLFFFKLFGGVRPTVLFRVRERSAGNTFAQITAATRTLVGQGYRIVIDASPNSVEPEAMATRRQLLLEMDEMSREVVMRAPEFKAMFERLAKVGLDELVWQTLGGVASSMVRLATKMSDAKDESIKRIVETTVRHELEKSVDLVRKCSADVEAKLLPLFIDNEYVSKSVVKELGIVLAAPETGPDKVLRNVTSKDAFVPASPEMGFVLRHRLYQKGMFEKMQSFDFLCEIATKVRKS
jgi:hypothetical protein